MPLYETGGPAATERLRETMLELSARTERQTATVIRLTRWLVTLTVVLAVLTVVLVVDAFV